MLRWTLGQPSEPSQALAEPSQPSPGLEERTGQQSNNSGRTKGDPSGEGLASPDPQICVPAGNISRTSMDRSWRHGAADTPTGGGRRAPDPTFQFARFSILVPVRSRQSRRGVQTAAPLGRAVEEHSARRAALVVAGSRAFDDRRRVAAAAPRRAVECRQWCGVPRTRCEGREPETRLRPRPLRAAAVSCAT